MERATIEVVAEGNRQTLAGLSLVNGIPARFDAFSLFEMGRMSVCALRQDPFPFHIPRRIYNLVNSNQRVNGVSAPVVQESERQSEGTL